MRMLRIAALFTALLSCVASRADVVINEIFYRAPNELHDLQWIEIHNTADQAVDLGEWTLDQGKTFTFPKGTTIAPQGYVVVALKPDQFRKAYGTAALGPMKRPLKRSGERLHLYNDKGEAIDSVRYQDGAPWPVSADGYSASLERICPTASGEKAENWAASPLPTNAPRPAGTPGKRNASFSAALPPVIGKLAGATDELTPGQPLRIDAQVKGKIALREVSLLYRTVTAGVEGKESAVPMLPDAATGRYTASIPPQAAETLIRYRIKAVNEAGAQRLYPAENDLRPALSTYVHEKWELARIPFGFIIHVGKPWSKPNDAMGRGRANSDGRGFLFGFGGAAQPPRPPRGTSAFVYVDQKTGKTALFDYVNIVQRSGNRGYKVHFHKDRTFNGMSVVSIIFEGNERFLLAEAMAYDVYRRAGNAACLTDFIRLWVDGRMVGYHLMIEQPNPAFLRRNGVHGGGNLYKLIWFGRDVVGQHQKRTNSTSGHEDLLSIIDKLQNAKGEEQWKLIQANFNVDQVATYFAVNMVLSHWDGYFNNYFTYHDTAGSGKWEMYPWDQDKTWGYFDGISDDEVFSEMPLTFGMEGDRPPAGRGGGGFFGGGPFGGGVSWWRPGGYFSRPLLANPQFRKVFLARTREIAEKIYTQETYFPLIDELADRLKDDVRLRAKLSGDDPEAGTRLLAHNVQSLRSHLLKRRQFLLERPELRAAGANAALPPAGGNKR